MEGVFLSKAEYYFGIFYRISETCSHVGAILSKIEAGVRKGFKPGCTDVAFAWNNNFQEDVKGEKIKNILLYGET